MGMVNKKIDTEAECKQKQIEMKRLAWYLYSVHRAFLENWHEGEPIRIWYDAKNNLCVKYESGKWWHYKVEEQAGCREPEVVWW